MDYIPYTLPDGLEYVGDGSIIRKTAHCTGKETLSFIQALCHHLIAHPDPMIVPVYSYQYLGAFANNTHQYQYEMMRLHGISQPEEQICWQVGDAWRAGARDPTHTFLSYQPIGYQGYIDVSMAWEQYPKLMSFLQEVVRLNRYHDLHGENVMLDNEGNYRLIDIESFLNAPLSRPSNQWITHP